MDESLAVCPLVVDMDGTLIRSDMLHESMLKVVRDSPVSILWIPIWLSKGKAVLKRCLASRATLDPRLLPYNDGMLEWLKKQQIDGRRVILCTASDQSIAKSIAEHLNIFDDVIASDGIKNIAGNEKADVLDRRFGHSGFDYVGNSNADLAVWKKARKAVVVNASENLVKKVISICEIEKVFPPARLGIRDWLQALRLHQWLKNLLLFVPLLAAHEITNYESWLSLVLAFFSFSLCASSVYIINDLLDLDSDRKHPHKHRRPFASGTIPVWAGVLVIPILLAASLCIGVLLGGQFLLWLGTYFAITCAYSWILKRLVLIDCLILAMLYTLRIVIGTVVSGHEISFWLLAFSIFIFLSLAFAKRYAEIIVQSGDTDEVLGRRGYQQSDGMLIQIMGIVSGYVSVLVFALYINSDDVVEIYRMPTLVWGAIPLTIFWISWIWLQTSKGKMHEDPIIYSIHDKVSLVSGLLLALVLLMGAVGLPW